MFLKLWNLNRILRATIIGWRVLIDRIPTKKNLAKRGVKVANRLCDLCKEEDETTRHLFFECKIVKDLWY